jgi:thiol:disulfide interchange protein DsbC
MKKGIVVYILVGIFVFGLAVYGFAETVEETLKKTFPNFRFDSVNPTDIKGIYEVVLGGEIAYFAPEAGYLILFGQIIGKDGINVTENRKRGMVLTKAKNLPLEKAIKMGNGKTIVIEFTDPDCPYCRQASSFFSQRNDVTRYVFFLPLPFHKDAENKVKHIFCSEDKAKAYEDAMSGRLDNQKSEVCKRQDVDDLLKFHKETAARMGINSTPFFIINNKAISGADIPKIEEAHKEK